MEFKDVLKDLMTEKNIKIADLVEKLNINNLAIVYGWLKGEYKPRLDKLNELANLFSCSLDFLLGRTENYEIVKPKDINPLCVNLTNILKEKNITRYKLKKDKIISNGLDYSIFNCKYTPNVETLIKLADYLDVSIDYLVGRL